MYGGLAAPLTPLTVVSVGSLTFALFVALRPSALASFCGDGCWPNSPGWKRRISKRTKTTTFVTV
jgi:hypothetical protein